MGIVTGIGGIFIKAKDPTALANWYKENLGIDFTKENYIRFKWINVHHKEEPGNTVLSFFNEDSDFFNPSESRFMISFRVKNLHLLLFNLKHNGVWVSEQTRYYDHGSFGWIMDPEGNKIELWEPKDEAM
ncbi:MAG: VOC family protein [Bacteroidetes bacterium]|nr:VOC family protein [Bacteroidota bacterium]